MEPLHCVWKTSILGSILLETKSTMHNFCVMVKKLPIRLVKSSSMRAEEREILQEAAHGNAS